jgi:hypothetical protein
MIISLGKTNRGGGILLFGTPVANREKFFLSVFDAPPLLVLFFRQASEKGKGAMKRTKCQTDNPSDSGFCIEYETVAWKISRRVQNHLTTNKIK